jgi:hypothetical protein
MSQRAPGVSKFPDKLTTAKNIITWKFGRLESLEGRIIETNSSALAKCNLHSNNRNTIKRDTDVKENTARWFRMNSTGK